MSYICKYGCRVFVEIKTMILKTLESKIRYRIKRNKDSVFILKDFLDLSDRDQIMRVLRKLIAEGLLIKLGYGLYAKAKISSLTGKTIPEKPLPELARQSLSKLGVKIAASSLEKLYDSNETTQVPTGRVIAVKGRVSRKIGYDGKYITLEKVAG